MDYTYYMIWCKTYEDNERWHMGRFSDGTSCDEAKDIISRNLRGGMGDDSMEVLRVEEGWADKIYTDYSTS